MIEPDDGPTDKQIERAGERYSESADAAARAQALWTHAALADLITTYADGKAHKLLDNLRERFWGVDDQVQKALDRVIAEIRESDEQGDGEGG